MNMKRMAVFAALILLLPACGAAPEGEPGTPLPSPDVTEESPSPSAEASPPVEEPSPPPEPSYLPEELVLTLTGEAGETLDTLTLTIDGALPRTPLEMVYSAGRMYFAGEKFADAFEAEFEADMEESLFTFCERNGLTADFDWAEGSILLYSGQERPEQRRPAGEKDALIRLEDIAALGPAYSHPDELLKMRVMAGLLWEYAAPFSIAWVPLYLRPADDYEVNVMRDYTRYNAEFVFTIDYMISRGGILGVHGYTHQTGRQNSIAGYEFGPGVNESEEAARERYELAIGAAETLGWTPHFFEFPHYASTKRQSEILEEYFDVIYTRPHNKWPGRPYYVENGDRTVVYLHTPQDYVHSGSEEDVAKMTGLIKNAGAFCSLFFHPPLDYPYITVTRGETGPPVVTYELGSPLRRILDAFEDSGRTARTPMYFLP